MKNVFKWVKIALEDFADILHILHVCIFIVRRFFGPKMLKINQALLKLLMHAKSSFFLNIFLSQPVFWQIFTKGHPNFRPLSMLFFQMLFDCCRESAIRVTKPYARELPEDSWKHPELFCHICGEYRSQMSQHLLRYTHRKNRLRQNARNLEYDLVSPPVQQRSVRSLKSKFPYQMIMAYSTL